MPNFKTYNQAQPMLLPPSLSECLPKDHVCFIINDIVNNLDLSAVEKTYLSGGCSAYHPRMMTKVLFYGYVQKIRSSRKLEAELYQNIPFRFLSGNQQPDHGTINLFRKNHLVNLKEVFTQIMFLAGNLKSIDFGDVAIDGTKIKANASKKNTFDQAKIDKFKQELDQFFAEADDIDKKEDDQFGESRGYDTMPKEMIDPVVRQAELAKRKAMLEKLLQAEKNIKDKLAKVGTSEEKKLKKNSTSNTTDPDCNLMKMKDKSYKMAYNVQLATTEQIITAYDLNGEPNDVSSFQTMVERVEENTGLKVETIEADAGYYSKPNLQFCESKDIDTYIPDEMKSKEEGQDRNNKIPKYDRRNFQYNEQSDELICPEGKHLKLKDKTRTGSKRYACRDCKTCPVRKDCTKGKSKYRILTYDHKHEQRTKEMREKLNSDSGKAIYLKRMSNIEPVIGNIKYNGNFTEFHCRGKTTTLIEVGLLSIAHNLIKTFHLIKNDQKDREEIQWNSLMRLQTTS